MNEEHRPYHEQRLARKNGLAPKLPPRKEKKPIPKFSKKRQEAMKLETGNSELVQFFKSAMKRMMGHCLNCHAKTERHVYSAAIFSICHILDKRETMCPSVAYNPLNWVELCPDCHREFDTTPLEKGKTIWDKREAMGIWPIVRDKLILLYPSLAPEEKRFFPQSVLDYMKKLDPFDTPIE